MCVPRTRLVLRTPPKADPGYLWRYAPGFISQILPTRATAVDGRRRSETDDRAKCGRPDSAATGLKSAADQETEMCNIPIAQGVVDMIW